MWLKICQNVPSSTENSEAKKEGCLYSGQLETGQLNQLISASKLDLTTWYLQQAGERVGLLNLKRLDRSKARKINKIFKLFTWKGPPTIRVTRFEEEHPKENKHADIRPHFNGIPIIFLGNVFTNKVNQVSTAPVFEVVIILMYEAVAMMACNWRNSKFFCWLFLFIKIAAEGMNWTGEQKFELKKTKLKADKYNWVSEANVVIMLISLLTTSLFWQ
jgi:hypothetical protein